MHRNIIENVHHHDTLGLSYTVSGTRDNSPPDANLSSVYM